MERSPTADRRRDPVAPVDRARPFGIAELFFSTTDRKGLILSGNEVFARVSGWSEDELLGAPHNIIRHPDMPRAAFRLLWSEIEAGRPVAAYVKNMAKDGAYYWVLALVTPADGGYLSIRVKPSSPILDVVAGVYADTLAHEQAVEDGDASRRKEAIEAGLDYLTARLVELGFPTYDAFMRAALGGEVKERERALLALGTHAGRLDVPETHDLRSREMASACTVVGGLVDRLLDRLDDYTELNAELGRTSQFVRELAEDVRLFSLNALLASTRVTGGAATLGAVADIMRGRSDRATTQIVTLSEHVAETSRVLESMFFPIAACKLQAEMTVTFVRELVTGGAHAHEAADDLGSLTRALEHSVEALSAALALLEPLLRAVTRDVAALQSELDVMRALEINGRVEAASAPDAGAVVTLFRTIGEQIATARETIARFAAVTRLDFRRDAAEAAEMHRQIERMRAALIADGEAPRADAA